MTDCFTYTLIGQSAVPEPDRVTWALWMANHAHVRVAGDQVGDYWISTVFLGIDQRLLRDGPPLLFETMVFWAPGRELKDPIIALRSSDWLEAERKHACAVQACRVMVQEEAKR